MKFFNTLLTVFCMVILSYAPSFGQTQIGNTLNAASADFYVAYDVALSGDGNHFSIGNIGVSNSIGAVENFNINGNYLSFYGAIFGVEVAEEFGTTLSLSADGNVIAIGGPGQISAGVVRVYDKVGYSYTLDQEFLSPTNGQYFGGSVSLSDDGLRLAVGDYGFANDPNETWFNGATRVYENQSGTWNQIGSTIGAEGAIITNSGWSVELSGDGNRLVVGDYISDNSGLVKVFEWVNDDWSQLGAGITGPAGFEYHTGYSVDINQDGSRIVVGSPQFEGVASRSGRAKIFEWDGSSWVQVGGDLLGDGADDYFGSSVSINDIGNRVAIGAPSIDAGMGYTKIYDESSNSWSEIANIQGTVDGDLEGNSVSLNGSGDRIVIGAPGNNVNATNGGSVRVFEMVTVSTGEVEVKQVSAYPNPTNGLVQLGNLQLENVRVINAFGREVLFLSGLQNEVDLSHLPAGVYFVQAQKEKEILQARIIKK